jgi:L-asparaginase II
MTKHLVGGSAAFDTRAMEMANGKLVVKMGAQGDTGRRCPTPRLGHRHQN